MKTKTAHVIAHSHWDREWYLPFETHRLQLVKLMDDLIETFRDDPDFGSFHLDGQYIVLEDYLAVRPEREAEVLKLVRQGKLVVGPWYILQDEFLVSSEANARNLLIGIKASEKIGGVARIGYFPDSFGNMGQAPQLIRQAGITTAVYGRGVKPVGFNNEVQEGGEHTSRYSEMHWESPDGTRVLAILFAGWYNNGAEIPAEPEAAREYWQRKLADAEAFASTDQLLFMNGCDHQPLQKDLSEALRAAAEVRPDVEFRQSSFPEYVAALEAELPRNLDVVKGELRSQFTDGWITLVNTASARVYIKQANVSVQTLLEKVAEPLSAMATLAGAAYPREELLYAWKTLLQNHPHDSICGCSVDEVHREMMTRFAKARQVAEALALRGAERLAARVDTSGFGEGSRPFVVFNTSGHARGGVVKAAVDLERFYFDHRQPHERYDELAPAFDSLGVDNWIVVDEEGRQVPAVLRKVGLEFGYDLPEDRFRQPYWAYRIEAELHAEPMPGIGYRTYALVLAGRETRALSDGDAGWVAAPLGSRGEASSAVSTAAEEPEGNPLKASGRVIGNGQVSVEAAEDGSFTLTDKENGRVYAGLGAYEDTGDIGNEYMYRQPDGEEPLTTRGLRAEVRIAEHTAVQAVLEIVHRWQLPVGADGTLDREVASMVPFRCRKSRRTAETAEVKIVTRLTLERDSRSVAISSTIDNTVRDHRIRMLFPTGLAADAVTADSIYELARRPIRPEAAWTNPSNAQHQNAFVSISDGKAGLTVANLGLNEYEALEEGSTLAVTLLRGTRELGDWGVFPTPEAQCLGVHTLEMKLIAHDGDVADSRAFVEAYQFPVPWTAVQTGVHGGALPASREMVAWQGEGLAFSALKAGEDSDDLFLRVFNVTGEETSLKVRPVLPAEADWYEDLDGTRTQMDESTIWNDPGTQMDESTIMNGSGTQMYESSIMEEAGAALEGSQGEFVQAVGPAKIVTVGIRRP
ncbi:MULTISPECIES: alpha-mannosidase [unclassified Paenibacillus]|uniref:alpha-mannosidase n=1 Tax=unclassified Paenibacillus TaxID=185978 RepID=UPI000954B01F|nr:MULTISPECIES: alpha-mannosidase [unclassified Paenibacillus]ASS66151.2 alpha-mannosidase [Paenibacillus sp. RUD330]SIQ11167.1 alpha-mannosidase [Paenibacillus sp. RU4X]SIQ32244.1 alpha-mannosidase [Paenibacillus sp. RU4T]